MVHDSVSEEFGSLVFSDHVMEQRLSRPTYKELARTIKEGKPLDRHIANEVAHAMKEWALEMGATHYTHWFQPLTGITSEKHDSFININADGSPLMSFSGSELIQSEPDASSFPSGGIRSTFEARGYTAWDPTSPAFIKDDVLCIPTAFISYTGDALDKKTPLLRSMVALETHAKRTLALFHRYPSRVTTTIGAEQEYFLISEKDYQKRPDLILCGRTLFGNPPAKGQELEEHYFGAIRPTVSAFMKELDHDLWKLGIPAKTKHNEVAPCQHELACLYQQGSTAVDNNLLVMEKIKLIASRHGLSALEHERPFAYVNGSGKHDNWSLCADEENLLDPSTSPEDNLVFLVFLTCIIAAVDTHADLLRVSVASAGNDHRLGGNEAPPAIVSIFLGDELEGIIHALITSTHYQSHGKTEMELGVPQLANVVQDTTDRNRTSPFAFTGNKFEFRMCGSQLNLAGPNTVLNTCVAEQLDRFASDLDGCPEDQFVSCVMEWIRDSLTKHQRIIFNGNGYSQEWQDEAKRRGLLNLKTTPEALPYMLEPGNIELFRKYGVMSERELKARYVAASEQYAKLLNIEANTMCYMARRMYLPALIRYSAQIAEGLTNKMALGMESRSERELLRCLTQGIEKISDAANLVEHENNQAAQIEEPSLKDMYYLNQVVVAMDQLRRQVDAMEKTCDQELWPTPSYNQMLFYV